MNTRGLVELIVLNVGLQANIISQKLFTLMVLIAITTTIMTTPLLHFIYPSKYRVYLNNSEQELTLHFVTNQYDDISDIILLIKLFNISHSEIVMISSLTETSSSTTDIVRATSNFTTKPNIEINKTICALMNINIKYNNIYGNPKLFVSEIVRLSNDSNIYITLIPYKTSEYNFIKNVINMSTNNILLMVSGSNRTHIFVENVCIEILVVVTDLELLEIIQKFENYQNIKLTAFLINKKNDILERMKKIKWYAIIDKPIQDIINIMNDQSFDLIFIPHLNIDIGLSVNDYDKENQLLGSIGTYLFINDNIPTIFILHSSTSYVDTLKKKQSNKSIAHIDTLFIDIEEKLPSDN